MPTRAYVWLDCSFRSVRHEFYHYESLRCSDSVATTPAPTTAGTMGSGSGAQHCQLMWVTVLRLEVVLCCYPEKLLEDLERGIEIWTTFSRFLTVL